MIGLEPLLGTSFGAFIGVTIFLMGGCAFMTGQAVAGTWKPMWQTLAYTLLLGCADRFLHYALFDGELLSVSGYAIDTLVLLAIALAAHRATQARKMVNQYPWVYERQGLFAWRERGTGRAT